MKLIVAIEYYILRFPSILFRDKYLYVSFFSFFRNLAGRLNDDAVKELKIFIENQTKTRKPVSNHDQ